jgi:hypothetical protein
MSAADRTSPAPPQSFLSRLAHRHAPLAGLGMTSLVIGLIGMLLFFLPILGGPISAIGLGFGVIGFVGALFSKTTSLRWSLGGILACSVALVVNLAIDWAPTENLPQRIEPALWRQPAARPYVPPPAP